MQELRPARVGKKCVLKTTDFFPGIIIIKLVTSIKSSTSILDVIVRFDVSLGYL